MLERRLTAPFEFCGYARGVQRLPRLGILVALGATLALSIYTEFPLCPLASSVGVPCPGCGLTRATLALLNGDVQAALRFHPLVWLLAPAALLFLGAVSWELLRDPSRPRSGPRIRWNGRGATAVAVAVLVLTLAVWLARFAGYLGGPVPVTTLRAWLSR